MGTIMTINLPKNGDTLPTPTKNQALLDALASRRSTKAAQIANDSGPSGEELDDIISLATRVPDHGKITPWRFVKISGDARQKLGTQMADIYKTKHNEMDENHYKFESQRFMRAHTILVLISSPVPSPKAPEFEQLLSAGAVGFALNLAAYGYGYAATWLTEWPAFDDAIKPLFNMTADEKIIGFFFIGTPKAAPIERERPDIAKIITEWK